MLPREAANSATTIPYLVMRMLPREAANSATTIPYLVMFMLPRDAAFLACPNVSYMPYYADLSGQKMLVFTALVHADVLSLGGIGIDVSQYGIPGQCIGNK